MTTKTIALKKGEYYWIEFGGVESFCSAKILDLIQQEGKRLVRFRIGMPVVGTVVTETAERFITRLVKE